MLVRVITFGLIAVALLGCAEERSINHDGTSGVPTPNLTDALVFSVSAPVRVVPEHFDDSTGVLIDIPDSVTSSIPGSIDISITHAHCFHCRCGLDRFELFYFAESRWLQIDEPLWSPCLGGGTGGYSTYDRLLSAWVNGATDGLFSASHQIWVTGQFDWIDWRLVVRAHDYQPRLVAEGALFADLLWNNGSLLVSHVDVRRPGITSYLDRRDEAGSVSQTLFESFDPNDVHSFIEHRNEIWTLGDKGIRRISESGQLVTTIAYALPSRMQYISWGLTIWLNDTLWTGRRMGEPYDFSITDLIALDLEKSIDSGYTIFGRTRALPELFRELDDIEWDGEYFHAMRGATYRWEDGERVYTMGKILRANAAFELVDSITLPVLASCIAWDGEAYWIAHRGTPELPSTDILLSRFYPR